jgi:hypothetical protein
MTTKPKPSTQIDPKTLATPARRRVRTVTPVPAPRPHWLTGECPTWCHVDDHASGDRFDDRLHTGMTGVIPLTAEEPPSYTDRDGKELWAADNEPAWADLFLIQHYREAEARIWVGRDGTSKGFHLTLDEAEDLAATLLDRVTAARDAAEVAEVAEAAARAAAE